MRPGKAGWGAIAAAAGIAVVAAYVAGGGPAPASPGSAEAKTVAVATVKREDLTRSVTLTAELRPFQDIRVYAKVSGYVKEIPVEAGDQVKAGQVLATLDVAEQRADAAGAEAKYREARLDYERIRGVVAKRPGLLALEEVDNARLAYEVAKAGRDRARAMEDYAVITAPFDGIVTRRLADRGELIQAGTSSSTQAMPVVYLADNTRLRLAFPVPESIVPQVKAGMPVRVRIPATGDTLRSEVARVSGSIDTATRTMEVEVDLDNPGLRLTPGMYASVSIDLDGRPGALAVPVQAVAGKDKPTVWVVNAAGQVEERAVTLGVEAPGMVEVLGGVAEGERVIFGSRTVGVGDTVTPMPVGGGGP